MINKTLSPFRIWFFIFLFFAKTTHAQTLVWEENFDAASVNSTTWTYDFGDGCERNLCGWGNSELQYYTSRSENARIENGNLVVEARRENFGGRPFTSARLKTEGRVHFKYGTVEARIKLPSVTSGLWPAFWTLGTIGGSWPSIGEIDIMEVGSAAALQAGVGNRRVSSATHWSNATGAHTYNTAALDAAVDLSADYHLYKLVWTSQHIKMYLDNVEIYSMDISGGAAANLSEFHTPHFLLLNLAVGGAYTGIYTEGGINAPLPGKMYVDYIRLYQNSGDELNLATNTALSGNFGILTDNTPVNAALTYGTDADLYYWNNLTNIPNAVPYEGSNMWAVRANAGNWFGMGVENQYKNLSRFSNGSLNFRFKTTYTGQFKIGIKTGHGESWINFPANTTAYGLQRTGNWSRVSIPLGEFQNPNLGRNIDLYSVKNAFMFAGEAVTTTTDFYFDDLYFSETAAVSPAPTVSLTAPTNAATFTPPATIQLSATASDADGTISKVEFFNGSTLIGTATASPYTFNWTNVGAGFYALTAKATDNDGNTSTSAPAGISVTGTTCSQTAANGDFKLDYFSASGTTYFKFQPLSPITGCSYALIYIREGSNGAYPGYTMTALGSDFIFSKTIAANTPLSIYVTYQVPTGGERNSSDTPISYVVGSDCSGGGGSTFMITPAPTPNQPAANVISLFSEAYTNRVVDTWSATWDQADVSDTLISNNATKIYKNLNYAGIEFTNNLVNASAMTYFHIDIWTENTTTFKVKLVDFGANGVYQGSPNDDTEHELSFTPALGQWVSYDLPLSNFTSMTSKAHLAQLILSGTNSKVYVDNVYFYNTAIPVELVSFRAFNQQNKVFLRWETASERNNKGFIVETSNDSKTWRELGFVAGNGTSNESKHYRFWDEKPALGINYYRLKQVDFDGTHNYSAINAVNFDNSHQKVLLFPNPSRQTVSVLVGEIVLTRLDYQIFDLSGRIVKQGFFDKNAENSVQNIDIQDVPNGNYVVQFLNSGMIQTEKLSIN